MKKYIVVTTVLSITAEEADKIDAKCAHDAIYGLLDKSSARGSTIIRTLVNVCHTQDEAMKISRRGAP